MLSVRLKPSEESTPAYAFLIDRVYTPGELVAKISFCATDVGEVFATTFIGCFSTFAWLVSHVLVSIAQGHLYITFSFLTALSFPPALFLFLSHFFFFLSF